MKNKIRSNSKLVNHGDIFVCIKGEKHDGHDYVREAINRGASYIVSEKELNIDNDKVKFKVVKDTKKYLSKLLKNYYSNNEVKLIGITGTNGKTTVGFLLYQALNLLGIKTAYLGTIGYYKKNFVTKSINTTPALIEIYEKLEELNKEGFKYLVLEVSSHSLIQGRVLGLKFDYAIFTNISPEHLDYHKDIESYVRAKSKLFKQLTFNGVMIINKDDKYYKKVSRGFSKKIYYSKKDYVVTYKSLKKMVFVYKNVVFTSRIINEYNVNNLMSVIKVIEHLDYSIHDIRRILSKLKLPKGRCEIISRNNKFIVVDYAHTPDAIKNIIMDIKSYEINNIYCIIGCGGNRDKSKRPMMGKYASDLSDYCIFTSDNPRDEDQMMIFKDMIKDIEKENVECIPSRYKAIRKGIKMLKKNDILLILGKGHENYQIIKGKKHYFSDVETVNMILRE